MIRVIRKPEPAHFDDKVRQPGIKFLNSLPSLTNVSFEGKEYWRRCMKELRVAYGGICAYTALYIEQVTGAETVEHFRAKNDHPLLAYEWRNFRFVCNRMNGRKGTKRAIFDPFSVPDDLFRLQFPSMLLVENDAYPAWKCAVARRTISELGLNDERCTETRLEWLRNYAEGHIDEHYLSQRAPLIARELARQGLSVNDVSQFLH